MKESSREESILTEVCLRNFKNGSNLAYLCVVAHFNAALHHFVAQLTQDENVASGIVQDCFNQLWLRRPVINTAADIEAFLFTTARRYCFLRPELRQNRGKP